MLHKLRDEGNTIVVIEHNLDVIKTADWVIDLGPEGGHRGGQIIAEGTPEEIAAMPQSHTGRFLSKLLSPPAPAVPEKPAATRSTPAKPTAAKTTATKPTAPKPAVVKKTARKKPAA